MKTKLFSLPALLIAVLLLLPGMSRARYLNTATGRFQTMDTFQGDQQDPQSLNKYDYGEGDPINNLDPGGNDIGEMLAVMNITCLFFAQIAPATVQASSVGMIGAKPRNKDAELLTGLIFAESSTKSYGGGENDEEKSEIGLTVLNRTFYATLKGRNGKNYNKNYGMGTVSTAIKYPGEFISYGGNRWNLVMSGDSLKPSNELNKLQVPDKDHLKLSIEAANFCTDGSAPLPTGLATVNGVPGQFPISFNKAANSPPNVKRQVKFVHVGSHTFYSFKPGRETE